jgi:uncharacterized protein with HEPN domain
MRAETPAHLWDALEAAKKSQAIIADLQLDDYLADWIRQAAVERQLEIVGEALGRVRRDDVPTADRIPEIHAIIATRNVIVHRYDDVDHVRVWAMLQHDVPALIPVLESMLKEYGPPNT